NAEGAAPRRDVAARRAGGAVPAQIHDRKDSVMTLGAWLLVWLALAAGLLQVVICGVLLFSSGWAVPVVLLFAVLAFVPLILMQEIRGWRRLNPIVPATAAILSIAASGGFYWELFTKMAR